MRTLCCMENLLILARKSAYFRLLKAYFKEFEYNDEELGLF